jgi:very-short-patch-repair endonuclease
MSKEKKSKNNKNIFYVSIGYNKLYRLESPVDIIFFKNYLIDKSNYCSIESLENKETIRKHYEKYLDIFYSVDYPDKKISNLFPHRFFNMDPNQTRLKYYIDRGFNLEAAKEKLIGRQDQTSLKSFIKKYGNDIGKKKFDEYRDKWKESIEKHDKKELYKNWVSSQKSEYWIKKINPETGDNYTMEEANLFLKKWQNGHGFKKMWKEYREGTRNGSFINTTLEYFLNKGLCLEEARIKLKERQATFSLEKLIQKYGKKEGIAKWEKRQEKWMNTMNCKSDEEKEKIFLKRIKKLPRFSKESKNFFDILVKNLPDEIKNMDIFYADNEMILYNKELKKPFFYDFSIPKIKIIIEYNGSIFHPNPEFFDDTNLHEWKCPYTKLNGLEKKEMDLLKNNFAIQLGYDVIVIWDTDEIKSKLIHCLEIIYKKYTKIKKHL